MAITPTLTAQSDAGLRSIPQTSSIMVHQSTEFARSIIIVDSQIPDFASLVRGRQRDTEVYILNPDQDSIQQITELLQQHSAVTQLYLIAHGRAGQLHLGTKIIDRSQLIAATQQVQQWFTRTPEAAEIHLYACQTAAGTSGIDFLQTLHQISGAKIAAATGKVGDPAQGGSWTLDYRIGNPTGELPIDPVVLANYSGLLAAPLINDALTITRSTPEDAAYQVTHLSISDADGGLQTVTVTVANGLISLASTSNLTISNNGTSSVTLSGRIADINAALDGMTFTPPADFADRTSLTITANDGTTTVSRVIDLNVTPVNDAPSIAPSAPSVAEGSKISFAASNFGIADLDNLDVQVIVKITQMPEKGYLTLGGSRLVIGSTFSYDQISALEYHHDGTQTTIAGGTSDFFQVSVDDGAGGVIPTATIPITITPVNQLPSISGANVVYEGQIDYPVKITIQDVDQTAANFTIKITSLPADGVLKLDGSPVAINQTFSSADLAKLTYTHDGNDQNNGFPPDVSFNIEVIDDGGGTGLSGTQSAKIDLKVLPNNDDPILAKNTGLAYNTSDIAAGGFSRLITADQLQVTDVDSATTQLTYTLTAIPNATIGTIQLDRGSGWQILGAGATFTQDDLLKNRVRYVFHKNATGVFNDSFSFTVRDSELRDYPSVREGGIWLPSGSALAVNSFNLTITVPSVAGPGGTPSPDITGNASPYKIVVGTATAQEAGAAVAITQAMLEYGDPDNAPDEIVYRVMQLPTSGILRLNGQAIGRYGSFTQQDINDGKVTFQHLGEEDFLDGFTFTVSDGRNVTVEETFQLDITPQNDAPIVTVKGSPTLAEGGTITIDSTYLGLNDVDGTGEKSGIGYAQLNTLTFRITQLPTYGKLEVDQGAGFVEVTTATVITKAQLDQGKLRYTHNGTENFADGFSVQVNDNTIGTSNNLSEIKPIQIAIAKLNDAPASLSSEALTVAEAGVGVIQGASGLGTSTPHLVYQDPDNTTIQRQFRITNAVDHGSLLLNGKVLSIGSVFTQADLDNGRISYQHNGSEQYTDRFEFTVSDGGGNAVPGTYNITITPANDPPTLKVPGTQTFDTATPLTFNGANGNAIVVGDVDLDVLEGGEVDILQVTLDLQAGGVTYGGSTLTLGSTTNLTILQGTSGASGGKITFQGTKADVQKALDGLQVQVPTDEDRTLNLVVTVDDLLNGLPGAPAPTGEKVTRSIAIQASNINDPATLTHPLNLTVNEDTRLPFSGVNAISIADVDSFSSTNNTVTLSVTQGKLSLTDISLVTGGTNDSSTITLTGSLAAINAVLAGLSYQGNSQFNGNDTLAISFNDQGNVGGAAQIVNRNIPIVVQPVNDQPSLIAPNTVQTIANTNPLIFSTAQGNAITIDDLADLNNNGADTFEVTLDAISNSNPYGTLTAAAGSGATITGSGASITISGTKAQVNAALNGLSYAPADYNSEATVSLAVTVKDQANGGAGILAASQTITINTSDTNNAPVVTTPATIVVNEDTQFTFSGANLISINDPDDFGAILKVTLSVTQGNISLGSIQNLVFKQGGNNSASMVFEGTEAAINAALNNLKYQGVTDFNGPDVLTIKVDDLGNTGSGGNNIVEKTVNITVGSINDAPTRSASSVTLAAVNEDAANPVGAKVSSLLNPVFRDGKDNQTAKGGSAANNLAGIAITNNEANGSTQGKWQWFDGVDWQNIPTASSVPPLSTSAAFVLAADTFVRFLPNANYNGTPGNLAVRLIDDSAGAVTIGTRVDLSGSKSGGTTQYSNSSNAVTIGTSISAVNDAPIASGTATLAAIDEDTTSLPGDTVSNLFSSSFNDAIDQVTGGSNAHTFAGIAIVGNAVTTAGSWEYYNSVSNSWQAIGARSASNALIVKDSDKLRFVPATHYNGAAPALSVHLIDSSIGSLTTGNSVDLSGSNAIGETTAYSAAIVPLNTVVNPVNDSPLFSNLGGTINYTENAAAVVLDGDAIVQDVELGGWDNWSGATLTLQRSTGANAQDQFVHSGTLDNLIQGNSLIVDGATIGTITKNANGQLILTFNANATTARVNRALQQISYQNSSEDPPTAVTISYTLSDGNITAQGSGGELTVNGTVTVNITPINDLPGVGAGGLLAYTENQTAKIIDNTVTINDVDDTQIASATVTISSGFTIGDILAVSTAGTAINATYDSVTGVLSLTGVDTLANYQQVMRAVTYRSSSEDPTQLSNTRTIAWQVTDANSDGAGAKSSTTVTSTIVINALPDPVNDNFVTPEDTPFSSTVADLDAGETPANYSIQSNPTNGTVVFNADGSFTYTPNADFNGSDSFVYKVTDSNGDFATATATIVINSVQDIQNDSATVKEDSTINLNVLANDSFAPGAVVSSVSQGNNGQVVIDSNGIVKYTPNPNFHGTDSFTYTVISGGILETATVTITVDPVPDAENDVFVTNEDTAIGGTVADADPGSNPATYSLTVAPSHGSLNLNADGSFTYTPDPDFHGSDSFTYTVTDANGDQDTAIATVTVNPIQDTQVDSATTDEDTSIEINVLGNGSHDRSRR
ncbi:MAG: tandem-95 repeat protein [Elainella sp. Prado103]|nr:tandem-95 repeat protein [Elainella sp. Prado103]